MKRWITWLRLALAPLVLFCAQGSAHAEPIFANSVVSNDLEFIKTSDPAPSVAVSFAGRTRAEMPDKRSDALFVDGTLLFEMSYEDGPAVQVFVHPDVGNDAESLVKNVAGAAAKLPAFMRGRLSHVVIHSGDLPAFAEDEGRFFVLYSANILDRISTHDLEETVFHEAVHATLDVPHARSSQWKDAQRKDGDFVTGYGARLPMREDMAESALFAWTLIEHPGRLPSDVEARVRKIMPNRLRFFEKLFEEQAR